MITDVLVVVLAVCAGGAALVLAVGLASWTQRRPRRSTGPAPSTVDSADPLMTAPQARELARHADVAAWRAEQAATALDAARDRHAGAEAHRAAIEARYDRARAGYAEALRAVQAGRAAPPTPEQQYRRHEVSSAALAAYRRGELSVDELHVVFQRTVDWDPRQTALEREAERLAAAESQIRREYDAALAATRLASERLHVADVAATACTQEAVDAAVEAQLAADEVADQPPARRQPARPPRPRPPRPRRPSPGQRRRPR